MKNKLMIICKKCNNIVKKLQVNSRKFKKYKMKN